MDKQNKTDAYIRDVKQTDTRALYNDATNPRENDPRHYISMMTSASHTYGNAIAFISDWVIKHFPKNTFKTIHTSTKIAHQQIKSFNSEFVKKSRPMIIFRPRIADYGEDKFLKGTLLIDRHTDLFSTWGGGILQPFIQDKDTNFLVSYQLNRSVINIDVTLIFDTYMQQQDYVSYINNAFRINHPFLQSVILESYIPEDMIAVMGKVANIPVYDDNNCTQEFFTYYNTRCCGGNILTYKLQDSTGRKEFFRCYPTNMEIMVGEPSYDDGNKQGQVNLTYQVNFPIRLEFNTTGLYYLFSDNFSEEFRKQLEDNHSKILEESNEYRIIPNYVDIMSLEDAMLPPGWTIYTRASCMLDKPRDEVNITSLLNQSLKAAIDYHLDNGLPVNQFFGVRIRKQGNLCVHGRDYQYIIDSKTREHKILFNNKSTAFTYNIVIVVDIEYINDLIRKVYKIE